MEYLAHGWIVQRRLRKWHGIVFIQDLEAGQAGKLPRQRPLQAKIGQIPGEGKIVLETLGAWYC